MAFTGPTDWRANSGIPDCSILSNCRAPSTEDARATKFVAARIWVGRTKSSGCSEALNGCAKRKWSCSLDVPDTIDRIQVHHGRRDPLDHGQRGLFRLHMRQ